MVETAPYLGIDFGTATSSMAWVNPRTGEAEIIRNEEGEEKTPSVVYFGDGETLVGTPAEQMLEDGQERWKVVRGVKRDLVNAPTLALPGRRVKPVEVAAAIFAKLKHDAEALHFLRPVTRAVVTVPAAFDPLQRDLVAQAARLASFTEVELLEEPIAAALAYSRTGQQVGESVLVYDLGAGTFDTAVLVRDEQSFRIALDPRGLVRCGGDDFDRALYDRCDELAQETLGRGVTLEGKIDPGFLQLCRKRKENLSTHETATFSSLLGSDDQPVRFTVTIKRAELESLIRPLVEHTVRQTLGLVKDAHNSGQPVDTIVLVGGSSRVPIVQQQLATALAVEPRRWHQQDIAVALGAAYHAATLWAATAAPTTDTDQRQQPPSALPQPPRPPAGVVTDQPFLMPIQDIFGIKGHGTVITGRVERGRVTAGDTIEFTGSGRRLAAVVSGIERSQKTLPEATAGDEIGVLFRKIEKAEVEWATALAAPEDSSSDTDKTTGTSSDQPRPRKAKSASATSAPKPSATRTETLSPNFTYVRTMTSPDSINAIAFSPDGSLLASGGRDKVVHIWDTATGAPLHKLIGHGQAITALAFSPDGRVLASASKGKRVRLWNLATGTPTSVLAHPENGVRSLNFRPDGQKLVTIGSDGLLEWDIEEKKIGRIIHGIRGDATFSLDGSRLAHSSGANKISLWNLATGTLLRVLEDPNGQSDNFIWSIASNSDGTLFASGGIDGTIRLWDPVKGAVRSLEGHRGIVRRATFSPDGTLLASSSYDAAIRIWNPVTSQILHTFNLPFTEIEDVVFSPDGRLLAGCGDDKAIRLWAVS